MIECLLCARHQTKCFINVFTLVLAIILRNWQLEVVNIKPEVQRDWVRGPSLIQLVSGKGWVGMRAIYFNIETHWDIRTQSLSAQHHLLSVVAQLNLCWPNWNIQRFSNFLSSIFQKYKGLAKVSMEVDSAHFSGFGTRTLWHQQFSTANWTCRK